MALAGPVQGGQQQQQQQLAVGRGAVAQRKAQRGVAEHHAQHRRIRRKAARQLQRHGQQRRRGKQPFLPRMGQMHGQRRQRQIHQQIAQPAQRQHGKKAQPQRPRQQNARRLAKIQPGDAAGHVGMDAGGGVRDAGAGFQQMLAHRLVGKDADIAGLVQEIGRVAGAHDHAAVRRGDGLAQQAARVLVRHRQVGVLVRGHQRPA